MPVSEYNHILVAVSFAVAIFASYTALNMAGRVAGSARSNARIWLMGGGFALGVGIWAMHFVGMLAMDHAMNMRFDPFLTGLSMLIAIGSSLFALWLVSAEKLRLRRLLPGALVMGLGISAMHYTGMAALQFASIIAGIAHGLPSLSLSRYWRPAARCGSRSACVMREQMSP